MMPVYSFLNIETEQESVQSDLLWPSAGPLAMLFVVAVCTDTLSTIYFMTELGSYGPTCEINPLFRLAAMGYGNVVGPILCCMFKIIAGFWVAWRLKRWAPYMFFTGIIISFWAAWYNMWGTTMDNYLPNILTWNIWGI